MSACQSFIVFVRFGRGWLFHTVKGLRDAGLTLTVSAIAVAALLLVAWAWMSLSSCGERHARLIGLSAQLAGFALVLYGLRDRSKLLRNHGLFRPFKEWWEQRPRLRQRSITVALTGVSASVSAGFARAEVSAAPDAPLDRRVAVLEQNLKALTSEVATVRSQVERNAARAKEAAARETTERRAADADLREKLENAVLGGIHLETLGVALFVLGSIVGAAAAELSLWFGGKPSCY